MEILVPILFVGFGLFLIFYIRPKTKNNVAEVKFMQTKKISEVKDMFEQMAANGLDAEYREFVELKGKIISDELVEAPFSGKKVAYCNSKLVQVTQIQERYTDSNGNLKTRVKKQETDLSNEQSSQTIIMTDSSNQKVVLEINGSGCYFDIPKTFDRFEQKNNLGGYNYFRTFSLGRFGAETIGFKMVENTIEPNQDLYVIGEAFKVGDTIHIGKPQDSKKPFIVTTKSEEDLVNSSNQKAIFALIGGIIAIIVGIILFIR